MLRRLVFLALVIYLAAETQYARPQLGDGDSWFHARLGWIYAHDGLGNGTFPWLPFTRLGSQWVDHELGWHWLTGFALARDAVAGAKAIAAAQVAFLILSIYAILERWNVRGAAFFALLTFLGSKVFLFRALHFRPHVLAIAVFLWALVALTERRLFRLFALSLVLAYLHGSFAILIAACAAHALWLSLPGTADADVSLGQRWRPLGAALAGAALALVAHPHFPHTFGFAFWHAGLVARGVAAGAEWADVGTREFLAHSAPALAVMATAGFLTIATREPVRRDETTRYFGLMALGFVLVSFRHYRFVEYWIPLGMLWAGRVCSARDGLERPAAQLGAGIAFGLLLGVAHVTVAQPVMARLRAEHPGPFDAIEKQIAIEAPVRQTVFHSDWADFPYLFFGNVRNRYISGLDPGFLASARPDLQQLYDALAAGEITVPSLVIAQAFGAQLALVHSALHPDLATRCRQDPLLESVLRTDERELFRLRAQVAYPLALQGRWLAAGARVSRGAISTRDEMCIADLLPGGHVELPVVIPAAGAPTVAVAYVTEPPGLPVEVALDGAPLTPHPLRAGLSWLRLRSSAAVTVRVSRVDLTIR